MKNLIRLFESDATSFVDSEGRNLLGLGVLNKGIKSCTVHEELNGEFELEMEYDITDVHYQDLKLRRIILTHKNPYNSYYQAFRIYSITKTGAGTVTVNAKHVSYDLSDHLCTPFSAASLGQAVDAIDHTSQADSLLYNVVSAPSTYTFNTYMDISLGGTLEIEEPTSLKSVIGGDSNSIISVWGGELFINNWSISLHERVGADWGAKLVYGKNILSLEEEDNWENLYSHVYPYYKYSETITEDYDEDQEQVETTTTESTDDDGNTVTNTVSSTVTKHVYGRRTTTVERTVGAGENVNGYSGVVSVKLDNNLSWVKMYPLDVSSMLSCTTETRTYNKRDSSTGEDTTETVEYTSNVPPTAEQIKAKAIEYMTKNYYDQPDIELTIDYIDICEDHEELTIGDTVHIYYPPLDIEVDERVKSLKYDAIADRYTEVEIGSPKKDLGKTISKLLDKIK